MRRIKIPRDRWSLALLALNGALLGLLLGSLLAPSGVKLPPAQAIDVASLLSAKLEPPPASGASLGDTYALLISQPLFHQDRKYTPPPKDPGVVQSPPPDFALTGFLDIPGRPPKAFLRERSGGRSLSVTVGDTVDGWTVAVLNSKQVELRQGDRIAQLSRGGAPIVGVLDRAASPSVSSSALPVVSAPTRADQGGNQPEQSPPAAKPPVSIPGALHVSAAEAGPAFIRASAVSTTKPIIATTELQGVTVYGQHHPHLDPPPMVVPQGPPHTFSQMPPTNPN